MKVDEHAILQAVATITATVEQWGGVNVALLDQLQAAQAELAKERERVRRLQRLAWYAPGWHGNARSDAEWTAAKACEEHKDMEPTDA